MWLIFFKLIDGAYEYVSAGYNLVPTEVVDKVLPVQEHVARQARKLEYDGEKLTLKDGETLLTLEELDEEQRNLDIQNGADVLAVPEPEIVEVQF
ncbi:hypothetical protein EVU91_04350 [Macrococcoides bohemicum]|uniref:hypothetical protein n=1 Tax=Macrococcoides bohemicum TaxID=1903056 RepID=UPI0010595F57|nr:hypothetical protein [Macrococcus bohemicus]TDL39381.1 hypothetical protein EVU91_04350 [Macrococcus bohemicus]